MSNSLVLEDIKEGEAVKSGDKDEDSSDEEVEDAGMTESQLFPPAKDDNKEESGSSKEKGAEATKAGEEKDKAISTASKDGKDEEKSEKPIASVEEVDPLEKLRELLESLPEEEQEVIRKNLDNIKNYPEALPLSAPWSKSSSRFTPGFLTSLTFLSCNSLPSPALLRHLRREQILARHDARPVR